MCNSVEEDWEREVFVDMVTWGCLYTGIIVAPVSLNDVAMRTIIKIVDARCNLQFTPNHFLGNLRMMKDTRNQYFVTMRYVITDMQASIFIWILGENIRFWFQYYNFLSAVFLWYGRKFETVNLYYLKIRIAIRRLCKNRINWTPEWHLSQLACSFKLIGLNFNRHPLPKLKLQSHPTLQHIMVQTNWICIP